MRLPSGSTSALKAVPFGFIPAESNMGLLSLVVGVVVLAFGLFQHLKGKRILAAPFRKTGELAKDPTSSDGKGAMSSQGKVIAPQQALESPCAKQPCLAYEVTIERLWEKVEATQDGTKTVTGADTLETLRGGAVFAIDDGSGPLLVDASAGGDFDCFKDGFKKELNGRGWASQVQFGELRFDVPVLSDSEKSTVGFRARERLVPVEGSLFVLGKIEPRGLVKPSWRSLLVSSKGREGLLGSIRTKKKASFIGGGVLAALSVPLMIFVPSSSAANEPSPERSKTQIAIEVARAKLGRGEKPAAASAAAADADPFVVRAGVASCDLPANSSCTEHTAPSLSARTNCELFRGTYAEAPCSRERAVGVCVNKAGTLNVLYEGGPMGLSRSSAKVMCPSTAGTLVLAPEPIAKPTALAVVEVPAAKPAVVEPARVQAPELPSPELEISAKRLTQLAAELNAECASSHCARGHQYIFTALSCDKSARWCQLDFTAMDRSSHQAFVATLPFTPSKPTRGAFDAAIAMGLSAFEREPHNGKLAPAVMEVEKKAPTRVAEPLAQPAPAPKTSVAAAPSSPVAPAPVVNTKKAKPSAAPVQRSNKNMAD